MGSYGVITMLAALSYGELAAAVPKAGGQYVYIREAFGRLPGFYMAGRFSVSFKPEQLPQ
ncbi:MAG: amino acid permease [Bacteroidia bacterium]